MDCHHRGASEQQLTEQALAININGVATQCIKHSEPEIIPIPSVVISFINPI